MPRIKRYGPVTLTLFDNGTEAEVEYPSTLALPSPFVAAALRSAGKAGMVEAVEFYDCGDVMVTFLQGDKQDVTK